MSPLQDLRLDIVATLSDEAPQRTLFSRWDGSIFGWIPPSKVELQRHGQIVSWCKLLPVTITVGQAKLLAVGVGGVQTISSERGKGYGTLLINMAANVAQQHWKPDTLLLFTFANTKNWYKDLGWSVVTAPVTIQQPRGDGTHDIALPAGVYLMSDVPPGSHAVAIESLPW